MRTSGRSIYPNLEKWIYDNYKSVPKFAREVGVSSTTMYNILKGKSDPSYQTGCAILRVTNMKFDDIFQKAEK